MSPALPASLPASLASLLSAPASPTPPHPAMASARGPQAATPDSPFAQLMRQRAEAQLNSVRLADQQALAQRVSAAAVARPSTPPELASRPAAPIPAAPNNPPPARGAAPPSAPAAVSPRAKPTGSPAPAGNAQAARKANANGAAQGERAELAATAASRTQLGRRSQHTPAPETADAAGLPAITQAADPASALVLAVTRLGWPASNAPADPDPASEVALSAIPADAAGQTEPALPGPGPIDAARAGNASAPELSPPDLLPKLPAAEPAGTTDRDAPPGLDRTAEAGLAGPPLQRPGRSSARGTEAAGPAAIDPVSVPGPAAAVLLAAGAPAARTGVAAPGEAGTDSPAQRGPRRTDRAQVAASAPAPGELASLAPAALQARTGVAAPGEAGADSPAQRGPRRTERAQVAVPAPGDQARLAPATLQAGTTAGATHGARPALNGPAGHGPEAAPSSSVGLAGGASGAGQAAGAALAPAGPRFDQALQDALQAMPLALAAPGGPAGRATTGEGDVSLRIDVPADSPQFAPALGTQLSLLVRNGVQTVRLELNPAEMGPIQVQIALDGNAAQVEFQASRADTRSLIEASLPALAGALQDAGLTLAGGGVFEHSQGRQAGDAPDRQGGNPAQGSGRTQAGREASAGAGPAAPRSGLGTSRGLVDLIA